MKRYFPFALVIVVALLDLAGGTMFYRAKRRPILDISSARSTSANSEGSLGHVRGNPKAPVTLEEFGDYQCPPCGKVAGSIKALEQEYGEQLRLVFHHFPLVMHQHAMDAACAAEAAGLQGRFWPMHDLLYREQAAWTKAPDVRVLFAAYAGLIGLDIEQFKKDMVSEKVKERVQTDQKEGAKLGVTSTPTLFVNNRAISTKEDPIKPLKEAIDAALKPAPSS